MTSCRDAKFVVVYVRTVAHPTSHWEWSNQIQPLHKRGFLPHSHHPHPPSHQPFPSTLSQRRPPPSLPHHHPPPFQPYPNTNKHAPPPPHNHKPNPLRHSRLRRPPPSRRTHPATRTGKHKPQFHECKRAISDAEGKSRGGEDRSE